MKRKISFVLLILALSSVACQKTIKKDLALLLTPTPNSKEWSSGHFSLKNEVAIDVEDESLWPIKESLSQQLLDYGIVISDRAPKRISLALTPDVTMADEAYSLSIQRKTVNISAKSYAGILYATQSFLQLFANYDQHIPCLKLSDSPRFSYRGFMLDESRHFYGSEKVKQLLDVMSYLKLNTLAWHLTDEPAWRLEIKAYPRLTTEGGKGSYSDATAPAQFYTQVEIKEIVAYAGVRGITIIPEIDMPGHATAANRAYPEYSGGGSEKHPEFTFNPGKEETYTYLTNILREVVELFPSQIIHFGGDEVHYGNQEWHTNADVKKLMAAHHLADLKAVEKYFSQRMADSIQALGKTVGAWDEAIDCHLDPSNTLIYWWRHDQTKQLKRSLDTGYTTILCPRRPLYFDFVQDSTHQVGRRWNGFCPYTDVYNFPDSLDEYNDYQGSLIKGIQANQWTETVQSTERFDFLVYTRLAALAEAAWTNSENKSIEAFEHRLKLLLNYYDTQDIYYYNPFDKTKNSEPLK